MNQDIKNSYNKISTSYLEKKQYPWKDFEEFLEQLEFKKPDTVIDFGGGNGRNLHAFKSSFVIVLDLSVDLLRGYVGPKQGQKVAGALPKIPFRSDSTETGLLLAVIHHFRNEQNIIDTLHNLSKVITNNLILSVWRRWRTGYREKLFKAIRNGQDIDPLINHERPWKSSQGEPLAYRFYHYYSFKELYQQISTTEWYIKHRDYLGGRSDDANIFVELYHKGNL